LPAHPAPGSAAIVRRRRSLRCHSSSPKGEPRLTRILETRGVLVRQRLSRTNAPLTLSVTPPSQLAEARHSGGAEDPSSRGAPTPRGSEPRAPSIDRSVDLATSEPATLPTAATAATAWPRSRSFGHEFHAHAVRARSTGWSAVRGTRRAPCPRSTSAIEMTREHTRGSTKLRHSCGGMPPLVRRSLP
jgi:hypothetical protein